MVMEKAAAWERSAFSTEPSIATVIKFHFPDTTKIIALIAVMHLTKEKANPEKNAGVIIGRVILLKVVALPAPKSVDASSI